MDISKYSENAKLFYVRKMDWSLTCRPKHDDEWTVYANGEVTADKELSFDDLLSDRKTNFSENDFENFCRLLDDFVNVEDDLNGCDGTGYEMILFNEKGGIIHKFNGYIYGNPCLQKIVDFVKKF